MKQIEADHFLDKDDRYQATFFNSLAGIKQAVLVGTRSLSGYNNLAIFNSLVHIGANPPLSGLIFRPATVERHTLENILETGDYTINYPHISDKELAHQTSARYNRNQSEFTETGFQEEFLSCSKAPFVKNAPVKIAMKFEQRIEIPINGTILIIGSIQQVNLSEDFIAPDGFVNLEKAEILSVSGLDAYYNLRLLARYEYARPGIPISPIKC